MQNMLELPEYMKRAVFTGAAIVGVLLVIGLTLWGVVSCGQNGHTQTGGKPVASSTPAPQVSPLLFGTNLDLFNKHDQDLTSPTTRSLLQSLHVHIIRILVPPRATANQVSQALKYIQSVGAVPVVNLQGPLDASVLADDTTAIKAVNEVFGASMVYYEYGEESDLQGVSAQNYTTSWNEIVPHLKQLAPSAQFVGPTTYQYDQSYLQAFLQRANPLPDAVSWHMYACADSWSQQQCLQQISSWDQQFVSARTVMQATIGTELPIMITEWNYAANASPNDGKANDNTFMAQWTSLAFQRLVDNRVFAAMQFAGTDAPTALINNGDTLTAQATTFQMMYNRMGPSSNQQGVASTAPTDPPDQTPTPTEQPTPTPTPTEQPTQISTIPSSPSEDSAPTPTPTPIPPTPTPTPTSISSTPTPTPTPIPPTPTPKPTPTPTPVPPTPTPTPMQPTARVYIWATDVNVHTNTGGRCATYPSLSCSVISQVTLEWIPAYCQQQGQTISAEGYTNNWWMLIKLPNGRQGWVSNIFIRGGQIITGVPYCHF